VLASESKISNMASRVRVISNQRNATGVKVSPVSKLPHVTLNVTHVMHGARAIAACNVIIYGITACYCYS